MDLKTAPIAFSSDSTQAVKVHGCPSADCDSVSPFSVHLVVQYQVLR